MTTGRLNGTVRVVGAGLLGTSVGLALRSMGVDVVLEDASPANQKLAIDYGAGRAARPDDQPGLIVVCVPPDVAGKVVADELAAFPEAVVTDVASVKSSVLADVQARHADLSRYVGSHPMAGRERGGAISGRADLFVSRPWVIAASPANSAAAIQLVENLALDLGSAPVRVAAEDHDRAVALVSHVPQLVSSLLAGRLVDANPEDVSLAGQGLRDTTRIAASDPKLWMQILGANSAPIAQVLHGLADDLAKVVAAMDDVSAPGSLATIGRVLEAGNRGVERIPGKHGTKHTEYAQLVVIIEDRPGELGRLFNEVGEIGVNIEELKLEHSPSAQVGLVELYVMPNVVDKLSADLVSRGWRIAG